MPGQGVDLIGPTATATAVLCGLVAAAGGLAFKWGIPIAGFYWYRISRSTGRLVFLVGFAIYAALGFVGTVLSLVGMFAGGISIESDQLLRLTEPLGLVVALVGFIIIVVKEEKPT